MEVQRTIHPEVLREHGLFRESFLLLEVQAESGITSRPVWQFHPCQDGWPIFFGLFRNRRQVLVRGGLSQRRGGPCDERHDAGPAPADGNPLALTTMFRLSDRIHSTCIHTRRTYARGSTP